MVVVHDEKVTIVAGLEFAVLWRDHHPNFIEIMSGRGEGHLENQ